jgi:hypothetical protein
VGHAGKDVGHATADTTKKVFGKGDKSSDAAKKDQTTPQ